MNRGLNLTQDCNAQHSIISNTKTHETLPCSKHFENSFEELCSPPSHRCQNFELSVDFCITVFHEFWGWQVCNSLSIAVFCAPHAPRNNQAWILGGSIYIYIYILYIYIYATPPPPRSPLSQAHPRSQLGNTSASQNHAPLTAFASKNRVRTSPAHV